jgi:hypothetical protein
MGLKSFLGNLFGGGDDTPKVTETVEYAGYVIQAQPKPQGGQYYTAGTISKAFPDGTKEQYFIRADTHSSADTAGEHAVTKARQIIDEQGDRLFKDD